MRPNNTDDFKPRDAWNLIDDVGYAHHIIVWMVILELEKEGVYPIKTPTVQQRMFRWWGEYQAEDRANLSIHRLAEHGIIDRTEVEEWPYGYDCRTSELGHQVARQLALTWLDVLECETREDVRNI